MFEVITKGRIFSDSETVYAVRERDGKIQFLFYCSSWTWEPADEYEPYEKD